MQNLVCSVQFCSVVPAACFPLAGIFYIVSVQLCEVYITSQHHCKWAARATQKYKFVYQNG